jgi:hypothetical protein
VTRALSTSKAAQKKQKQRAVPAVHAALTAATAGAAPDVKQAVLEAVFQAVDQRAGLEPFKMTPNTRRRVRQYAEQHGQSFQAALRDMVAVGANLGFTGVAAPGDSEDAVAYKAAVTTAVGGDAARCVGAEPVHLSANAVARLTGVAPADVRRARQKVAAQQSQDVTVVMA